MMTNPIIYPDVKLCAILEKAKTIAMIGASSNPERPSHQVMQSLQGWGYRVVPVNPGLAGQWLLGEQVYASLRDIPFPIDAVDIFRASEAVPPIVDEAIAIKAKVVWMQSGIRHDSAAARAEAAGLDVVMDHCMAAEFNRLQRIHGLHKTW